MFSSSLMGRSTSLAEGRELAFSFFFIFFFRHIFYLYVCIKGCQEMHLVPKSRISHSCLQLTAFQAPFFVISAQTSCRQSSGQKTNTSWKKKGLFSHQCWGEWHSAIFNAIPCLLVFQTTHFLINIFSSQSKCQFN